ncbi:MAG: RNA polymerase sigma factor [Psychrosphaera sp.]|nr:RNA polymerase sigma factor [Psychrosphaera sp.]
MLQAKEDMLVIAAQQGNEQAFSFLCRHYQTSLSRFAYKLCGDHQMVQDALQNAWVKMANKLRILEDPRAFKSWIFRSVRWSVYDLMRKSMREETLIEQDEIEAIEAPQIQDNDHNENLLELIDQLPDIDKQAIYLFYLEEMTISQIANVLQIPAGTVKSRLNRSRKNLQKMATERSAKEGK